MLALLFGLVTGGIVWEALDKVQKRTLRSIVSHELDAAAEEQARDAREHIDGLVLSQIAGARLLSGHRRIVDYLEQGERSAQAQVTGGPPQWLPEAEHWGALVRPSHVLLLDAQGVSGAFYPMSGQPLPAALIDDLSGLEVSAGGGAGFVFADGRLYLQVSVPLDGSGGDTPAGVLVLVVPVDRDFLESVQGGEREDVITAVFDGSGQLILATSDAERLEADTDPESLAERFFLVRQPLAEEIQGGGDFQLVTLVPRGALRPVIKQVSALNRHQRVTGAVVFVAVYTLLFMLVSNRLTRSLRRFAGFSQRAMGFTQPLGKGGNQLLVLEDWMRDYIRLVRDAREEMRARHETEIQESAALRWAIMEASLDSIITIDSAGRIIDFNPTAERSFAYSEAQALGATIDELIIEPSCREVFADLLERARRGDETGDPQERTELTAVTSEGATFPVELTIKPIDLEGRMLFTAYLHDISDRRQREEEIRALAALPSESPDPILRVNSQCVITYANDASEPLLAFWGCERGQTLPPNWRPRVEAVLASGQSEALEFAADERIYSLLLAPISGLDYINLYVRDITEERTAEELARQHQTELVHVCRLSTMGEMATGIAHELNQPLSAIVNYANGGRRRMEGGTLDRESLTEALNQIAAQASRAGEIIRRFRAQVSRQPTQRQEVAMNDLVTEVMSFVDHEFRKNGVDPETDLAPDLPLVRADLVQIEQLLLNLVRNAIDAVSDNPPGERRVRIRTHETEEGRVRACVEDNGPGLTPDARAHLFDPFFTTKSSGMGMGLAISQTIAEDHGGKITADNADDGGARFTLELPAAMKQFQAANR